MEIRENAIYTSEETENILKISRSTFLRLIKKGLLQANKVGGQYRILGREIMRLVSPEWEDRATLAYRKMRNWVKRGLKGVLK